MSQSANPEPPRLTRAQFMAMSGLEAMRALSEGRAAPPSMVTTLGFELVEVADGVAIFTGRPGEGVLNPLGGVHGGWALSLLDSCTGCAGHTTLPAGSGYTTLETKGNFVRAITPETGRVRAEGRVISRGRTIITCEGRISDDKGRLLAHGTSTLLVMSGASNS